MTYMIDARLEQGVPSLKLIDAATGEERLHWQGDSMDSGERGWKDLFKRLVLLSCADRLGLLQQNVWIKCYRPRCVEPGIFTN